MDVKAAAVDVVDQLTAAGVDATADYRDLPIPGVLLVPDTAAYDRLSDDAGTITFRLVAVAAGADPLGALDQLGALLDTCQQVADLAGVQFTTYTNRNISPDPLPCWTATITSDWEK